ncbi:MAG: putative esterase [Verrucomicrobia subdivision 3 bacterium]|nr:putative esterase [Limisphaerales bacterium]MCS1416326.1 putative esterase [Limisphaerales bacterium]
MPSRFVYRRRVEFADTDMAGIMHFSSLFRFMESAEHAFIRSLGHSVTLNDIDPTLGFPRVRAEADFRHPFRFEDEIEIELTVRAKRRRSITYGFKLRRAGDVERVVGAEGAITVVCVRKSPDGKIDVSDLPPELADKIMAHQEAEISPDDSTI